MDLKEQLALKERAVDQTAVLEGYKVMMISYEQQIKSLQMQLDRANVSRAECNEEKTTSSPIRLPLSPTRGELRTERNLRTPTVLSSSKSIDTLEKENESHQSVVEKFAL